jgi:hypothetical protein
MSSLGERTSQDSEAGRVEAVVVGHENPHARPLLFRIARLDET